MNTTLPVLVALLGLVSPTSLASPAPGGRAREISIPTTTALPSRGLSLATADFDRDGRSDLASAWTDGTGGIVAIQRGTGIASAPFEAGVRWFRIEEPREYLVTGDFDGDGWPDLLRFRLFEQLGRPCDRWGRSRMVSTWRPMGHQAGGERPGCRPERPAPRAR